MAELPGCSEGVREMQNSDSRQPEKISPVSHATEPELPTKTVYIAGVPHRVWQHARNNAMGSNMSFAEYVTMLLADSEPYPPAR